MVEKPPLLRFTSLLLLVSSIFFLNLHRTVSQLVPALYVFGDSTVDTGNNDYLATLVKANFEPYGRDFDTRKPTGRFSNGRVASDFLAISLGLPYPPPYLANSKRITKGVNFAGSGSGLYEKTSVIFNVPNLPRQLSWFRTHKQQLQHLVGPRKAAFILSKAVFVVSTGSNDYISNYYLNPFLQKIYSRDAYRKVLITAFENFVKELYKLGARRVSMPGLIPLGCLPSQVTLYGKGQQCAEFQNQEARLFNQALRASIISLRSKMRGLRVAYIDTYATFSKVIRNPSQYGFTHTLTSCCGAGRIEVSVLCNKFTPGTCRDASKYVFWDSYHPTDAMNKIIAKASLEQALPLLLG